MTYRDSLDLYLVSDGQAVRSDGSEDPDGVNSVFAAAPTPAAALQMASEYDAGLRAPNNFELYPGRVVAALTRDRNDYSHVARSPQRQVNLGFYSAEDAAEKVAEWDAEDGHKSPRDLNADNEVVTWDEWVTMVREFDDENEWWDELPLERLDNAS